MLQAGNRAEKEAIYSVGRETNTRRQGTLLKFLRRRTKPERIMDL